MKEFIKEQLAVKIFDTRASMGAAAADIIAGRVNSLLGTKDYVNIIFASAPSQNEFLAELSKKSIDWGRVNAFHMDEYVGLGVDDPRGFGFFLKEKLFDNVSMREIHYLNGKSKSPKDECKRYADLLLKYPADIVCLGIGENTHLAFNDPHVADFNDEKIVKIVDLDTACRLQQVNDGCFKTIDEVPMYALTITIPALFKARYAYAIAPGPLKAKAIFHTINSPITERYPSTILRKHDNAVLFIDQKSASKL